MNVQCNRDDTYQSVGDVGDIRVSRLRIHGGDGDVGRSEIGF